MTLDESILRRMRRRVEEAVGPIRASQTRKDRMREELYAHLHDSAEYEVEETFERVPREEAALNAIDRLGDSAELRARLEDAVPPVERIMFVNLPGLASVESWLLARFGRREGESMARWAARLAAGYLIVLLFIALVVNPLIHYFLKPNRDFLRVTVLGLLIAVLAGVNIFVGVLLHSGMHKALELTGETVRAPAASFRHGAMLALVVFLSGLVFAAGSWKFLVFDLDDLRIWSLVSLLVPLAGAFCSLATWAQQRRKREWEDEE